MRTTALSRIQNGQRILVQMLRGWQAENTAVAPAAARTNVLRMRLLCPLVAVVNAVHVAVFYLAWQANTANDHTAKWQWALFVAHACMGVLMVAAAVLAHQFIVTASAIGMRLLPVLTMAAAMAFAICVVLIDQWVTPSITPFLLASLITGVVIYLRPAVAFGLYACTYAGFYWGMGQVVSAADQLLSNRTNGFTVSVFGVALSVLLWRKFTVITRQHDQLESANAALERLTRLDGLTGLYNRMAFVEMSRREIDRAERSGSQTSILLLDLDHFKLVNDTWGHPAGDAVLQNTSKVLQSSVRHTDLVGRLGGEEFMVLLPDTSSRDGMALAEKLRQRLQESPTPWNGSCIPATVSIGLASTNAAQGLHFERLYQDADQALYQAKEGGRNRVVCAPATTVPPDCAAA